MRRRLKANGYSGPLSISLPASANSGRLRRTIISLPDDSPSALQAKFASALSRFLRPISTSSLVGLVLAQLRSRFRSSATAAVGGAPLLCLGLGNPAVDASSLRQLAFIVALVQTSEGVFSPAKTFIYDPVLKATSRDFIRSLGFCVSFVYVNRNSTEMSSLFCRYMKFREFPWVFVFCTLPIQTSLFYFSSWRTHHSPLGDCDWVLLGKSLPRFLSCVLPFFIIINRCE